MALRFIVPPNWPKPPKGWTPPPGWQPDPAWGPAPEGWCFWADDSGQQEDDQQNSEQQTTDSTAESADSSETANSDGVAESTEPEESDQPAETTEADDKTRVLDYNQHDSQEPSEPQEPPQEDSTPTATFNQPAGQGQPQPASSDQSYQQQTQPNYAAYQGAQHSTGQAYPYNQQTQPEGQKKKNFFTTTAGILTLIGSVLLVLIIALVLVFGMVLRGSSETESVSGSETGSSSSDFGNTAGDGKYEEYTGTGDETISVTKPGGNDQPAWLEFQYEGTKDTYNSFYITGQDSSGERSDASVIYGEKDNQIINGSIWIDTTDYYKPTSKLKIEADGKWTIRIYSVTDAPTYGKGDTVSGKAYSAFTYRGDANKVSIRFSGEDSTDSYRLEAYSSKYQHFNTLQNGSGSGSESSTTLGEYTGATAMLMESNSGSDWEITFE